ncbi:MAG: cation diffusion facilitator family transporter [Clostridiales bacterium]|jgi:cation diffusion facilitator family transporter|nr:cation diffusion facilitator family transporter [Clostridiales bacterium]
MFDSSRTRKIMFAAVVGLSVNLVLSGVKLYIGLSSNSLSIFSDSINNFADAIGFGIMILGFYMMRKKPTEEFPFGYGRAEYLVGFIFAASILFTGLYFIWSALDRLFLPRFLYFTWFGFGVTAACAVVKTALAFYFRSVNKKCPSGVLKGAETDSFLDAGITLMTLVGFLLGAYANLRLDAVVGIVIGIIITVEGVKLLKNSIGSLLGKRAEKDVTAAVEAIVKEYANCAELRGIETHDYGETAKEITVILAVKEEKEKTLAAVDDIVKKVEEKTGYKTRVFYS